ncbi:MAG: GNAT family N-acetyltransferase [Pseudomonadota bacterium]
MSVHDLPAPTTSVEIVDSLKSGDLNDLCDATEAAIIDGGGFGWVEPPSRDVMERYWKGVLTIPLRTLIVGRLDGVIVGSVQLVAPPSNNEAQAFAANLTAVFVAPWARGHGLAQSLVMAAEAEAREKGFAIVQLDVRDTQKAAIRLYENRGYQRWGTNPFYALVDGEMISGHYFCKILKEPAVASG